MIRTATIADQVYQELRGRILDGSSADRAPLRQEALAAELGVSRTPLREALTRLAAEGLIESWPRRSARVARRASPPGAAGEARLALEPAVAALAARAADTDRAAGMFAAVAALRSARDREARAAACAGFHRALARATGNPLVIRAAGAWLEQAPSAAADGCSSGVDGIAAAQEAIALAVQHGDAPAAARLTRSHAAAARRTSA